MAQVFPDDLVLSNSRTDGGLHREIEVLRTLEQALPQDYCLFHGVEWHRVDKDGSHHGEIDIVVMNRAGNLLLLEVKAGSIEECPGGFFKQYGKDRKEIDRQCTLQRSSLLARLRNAHLHASVEHVLVLPDYCVQGAGTAAISREHIIDADDFQELGSKLRALLPPAHPTAQAEAVKHFLLNMFRVSPQLGVLRDQLSQASFRLADGLATWVPRLHAPQGLFRIQATAGSGKTQLALRLLQDAAQAGQRAIYICFNRPLSDQMGRLAPTKATISTFHELVVDHYRRVQDDEPGFSSPGVWERMSERYVADTGDRDAFYDILIVDEGQDFEPEWIPAVVALLNSAGRFYLLADEDQQLYDRPAFDLADAVTLTCSDNFRSPRAIVDTIMALGLSSQPLRAAGPHAGQPPDMHVYDTPQQMLALTDLAVRDYLKQGYGIDDIVLLSYRGRGSSLLMAQSEAAGHTLRRHLGEFNSAGEPVWTDGTLLAETVFRYKGQAAPAIILTEIDFMEMDDKARRRLFVGLTRARMTATLIMSRNAERVIGSLLG